MRSLAGSDVITGRDSFLVSGKPLVAVTRQALPPPPSHVVLTSSKICLAAG